MLYVMGIKSTDMTNTIPTNMKNTISKNVSTSSDGKIVTYKMGCYILQKVLLGIIPLFTIAIICCHYEKHSLKVKENI